MNTRTYTIFAITATAIDGDHPLVFVGKTTQMDLEAVLCYHHTHNCDARPVFEEGTDICIHALDTVTGSVAEAYRYVLAYMRYFFEAGLDVVAHYKLYESCLDLSHEAQRIFNVISDKSLDDILGASSSITKSIPSSKNSLVQKSPLTARLNIRISQREYQEYRSFCQAQQVSQRDGLLMLLASNNSAESILTQRLQEQSQTIDQQRQRILHLDSLIKNGSRGAKADKRIIDALLICQQGIYQYIQHLFDGKTLPPPLPCYSWNSFMRNNNIWREYRYPAHNTPFCFQLQHLCYGKGPKACIFLFGIDPCTGEKLRIRFYDRREYIGPRPHRSPFFYEGVCLWVVCKQDEHGAADMLLGLPIPESTTAPLKTAGDDTPIP